MQLKIRLSRLRDIGWLVWDPIGLLNKGESWEGKPYADEYDSYLLYAAGQIRRQADVKDVIEYLVGIETEHMGLEANDDMWKRAEAVVKAIKDDDQLWSLPPKTDS